MKYNKRKGIENIKNKNNKVKIVRDGGILARKRD